MVRLEPWRGVVSATVTVPGDKSISHRGILAAALVDGTVVINGWLDAADTRSSLALVEALGVRLRESSSNRLVLESPGPRGLHEPQNVLDCGNSGTTMRLGAGLVSGIPGLHVLTGDASLRKRPMARVLRPLAALGATGDSREGGFAPVVIRGGSVYGGEVTPEVPSAQVKSSLLLAGLLSHEGVRVMEPLPTRDHTERLLRQMGADIRWGVGGIQVAPMSEPFASIEVNVPGDPSSAAFWLALGALRNDGSSITVRNVSLNPGRTGFLRVLERMGASLAVAEVADAAEPRGDVRVTGTGLRGTMVSGDEVPSLVDEVPLVALLGALANGVTEVRGAQELRVKESDRIRGTVHNLRALGVAIEELEDGFRVEGGAAIHGGHVESQDDHRLVMLAAIAATVAEGPITIDSVDSVRISYPSFFETFEALRPRR